MKLARGLSVRVLLVALIAGACGSIAAAVAIVSRVRQTAQAFLVTQLQSYEVEDALRTCDASPRGWSFRDPHGVSYAAYDSAGRPLGMAPSASETLWARARRGERTGSESARGYVRAFLHRAGSPCAYVEARFRARRSGGMLRGSMLAFSCLGPLAIVLASVLFIVVRPLRRRLSRMRAGASAIGDEGRYQPLDCAVDDELGELERSLDAAHARTVADAQTIASRRIAIERFMNDIAHDLRTPLAALSLSLEALDDEVRPELATLTRDALRETRYIGALVENLRLAARLGEGWDPMLPESTTDLVEVVDRVAAREAILARRKDAVLRWSSSEAPILVPVDATMVEQAITNLVQNAVTHTDAGGIIDVRLLRKDGRFVLEIDDEGPGVAPDRIRDLTERGARLPESRRRDPEGTGLGLAIVQTLCHRAGWELLLTPRVPRGLTAALWER